jgi:hypothetical protein
MFKKLFSNYSFSFSYYILVIENMETTLDAIHDFDDSERPKNIFREEPTTDSCIEISSMQFQYYGKHRLILYHVLPDYALIQRKQQQLLKSF